MLTTLLLALAPQEAPHEPHGSLDPHEIHVGAVVDVLATARDGTDDGLDAELRALEIELGGSIDDHWSVRAVGVADADGIAIEEAAIAWSGADPRVSFSFGRFFADFGPTMREHVHELPYVDRPLVLEAFLGDELGGSGIEYAGRFRLGARSTVRTTLGIFAGLGEEVGGTSVEFGERRRSGDLDLVARLTHELGPPSGARLRYGLSLRRLGRFAFADDDLGLGVAGLENTVLGVEATLGGLDRGTDPPWTFGGEFLVADGALGAVRAAGGTSLVVVDDRASGWYLWGERRLGARDALGVVLGSVERGEPGLPRESHASVAWTHRPVEHVRVRVEVGGTFGDASTDETRVAVQITATLGSHSHAGE
ncbi:MAG: hypothetical protein R3F34_11285 [Planctomycetota bacterium]